MSWTRTRVETQREVGYHVNWLDGLRREMGGLGVENIENSGSPLNVSGGLDALLIPRQGAIGRRKLGGGVVNATRGSGLFAREV